MAKVSENAAALEPAPMLENGYLTYILSNARNKAVVLPTPDDFADRSTAPAGGCAL